MSESISFANTTVLTRTQHDDGCICCAQLAGSSPAAAARFVAALESCGWRLQHFAQQPFVPAELPEPGLLIAAAAAVGWIPPFGQSATPLAGGLLPHSHMSAHPKQPTLRSHHR